MSKSSRAKPLKALNIVLTVGVLYFAFIYGRDLIHKAHFHSLHENYPLLILAFLLFALFYAVLSAHWLIVCRLVRKDTNDIQALAFSASQPYKYLPTSLFTFSFRAKYAGQLGLPVKESSLAQVLENLNIIGGGALTCLIFWLLSVSYIWGIAAILSCLLILYAIRANEQTVKIYKMPRRLPLYRLIPAFLVVMVAWVLSGLAFLMVNYSLGIHPNIWIVISANAGAYAASILAFFAPGGIGIRELVLAIFSINNAPIILWRLLTFAADMLLGFASVLYIHIYRRTHEA